MEFLLFLCFSCFGISLSFYPSDHHMGFHFLLSLSMELAVTQNSYYYFTFIFIFMCFLNLDPFKPLFILPLNSKWGYLILSYLALMVGISGLGKVKSLTFFCNFVRLLWYIFYLSNMINKIQGLASIIAMDLLRKQQQKQQILM